MSLFDFELPHVQGVVFDPAKQVSGLGSGAPASGLPAGSEWFDISGSFQSIIPAGQAGLTGMLATQVTPVTLTNPLTNFATAGPLMTVVFPAGSLNVLDRTVQLYGAGEYTTDSNTGRTLTIGITASDGTQVNSIISVITAATTASQTSLPWSITFTNVTTATGATGTMFGHGAATIKIGTAAAGLAGVYMDQNAASFTAQNLTKAITFTFSAFYGGSNAGNTITQDLLTAQVSN